MIKGQWRKSSFSNGTGGSNCVEVRPARYMEDTIHVRNSNTPNGAMVSFTYDEWRAFVAGVKAGEFDIWE